MAARITHRIPLLMPAAGLVAGIMIGMAGISLWGVLVTLFVALILWLVKHKTRRNLRLAMRLQGVFSLSSLFVWISIGICAEKLATPSDIDFENTQGLPPTVVAEVESVVETTRGSRAIVGLLGMADYKGDISYKLHGVKAIIYTDDYLLSPNQKIRFVNGLSPIEKNPNYQSDALISNYLRKGIKWQQRIKASEMLAQDRGNEFKDWCQHLRDRAFATIEKSGLDRHTVGFLATLLLGDNTLLFSDDRAVFADAGISHVLAVSGLHTGIIASLILLLTAPLLFIGMRRGRYLFVIILTWCYVMLCGWHISAVRSAIMVTAVMGGLLFERHYSSFNALCLALIIILLYSPHAVFDPGLQLSFLCVASLICFGIYSRRLSSRIPIKIAKLCSLALASIVTVFGSWAVTAYYFHTFPLMFLPVNLLILPVLPIYLVVGLLHIILSAFGIHWALLISLLDGGYSALLWLCNYIAAGTVMSVWVSAVTPLLWILGLAFIAFGIHRHSKPSTIAGGVVLAVSLITLWVFPGEKPADGVIVRTGYNAVAVASYEDGIESVSDYRIGDAQALYLAGKKICITGQESAPQRHFIDSCDLLVVTCGKRTLTELQVFFRPRQIALHPSLRSNERERLLISAKKLSLPVIDMREEGPVRLLDQLNQ